MGVKIITKNKRASYDYFLEERYEAGLMLQGTEVKSLRQGKANIADAFITIDKKDEAWVHNMKIPLYEFGNISNHKEDRRRKLLLNHKEIAELKMAVQAKGMSILPVALYFKKSLVKLEIALGKGKKLHDKRQDKAKKDVERKLQQGKYE
jgi:SsrA-binding protein